MSVTKPALTVAVFLLFAVAGHYLYRMFMGDYYISQAKEIEKGKDWNTAIHAYERAIAYAPGNPEYHYFFGRFYLVFARAAKDSTIKETLLQRARAALEEARKGSPQDARTYLALAQTAEAMAQVRHSDSADPTEPYYHTAESLYPNSAPYRYLLARYYKERGEPGKAMSEIETMITLDPSTDKYIRHNGFWAISNMDETAEKALRQGLQNPFTCSVSASVLASRLAEKKKWLEAARVYEQQMPEGAFAGRGSDHLRMGQYLLLGGKEAEAEVQFFRAFEAARDLSAGIKRIITIYKDASKLDQLFVLFEKLKKRFPEAIDIDLYWAQALYEQKNYGEALARLDRFLTSKETAEADFWIAKTYEKLERLYEAETSIRRAIKWDPENAGYHHFYAGLLYDSWRLAEALTEADKAVAASANTNPWYLDRKAWILYRMERYPESVKAWKSAAELKPGHKAFRRCMDMAAQSVHAGSGEAD
jgi:tetratricopeptide (TPR) repeat protein